MIKKIIAFMSVLSLLVSLCACGYESESKTKATSEKTFNDEITETVNSCIQSLSKKDLNTLNGGLQKLISITKDETMYSPQERAVADMSAMFAYCTAELYWLREVDPENKDKYAQVFEDINGTNMCGMLDQENATYYKNKIINQTEESRKRGDELGGFDLKYFGK